MSADEGAPAAAMPPVDGGGGWVVVEVAYSPCPGCVDRIALRLPAGCTVADALQHSAIEDRHPALRDAAYAVGVWGRRCPPQQPLRDADRVEIYRPLRVDPKEARHERQRRHDERVDRRPAGKRNRRATTAGNAVQPGDAEAAAPAPATSSPTR